MTSAVVAYVDPQPSFTAYVDEPSLVVDVVEEFAIDVDLNGVAFAPAGSGGAVDSVNGQTGTVVLDATDVGAATEAYVDAAVLAEHGRAESVEGGIETDLANEVSRAEAGEALALDLVGQHLAQPVVEPGPIWRPRRRRARTSGSARQQ